MKVGDVVKAAAPITEHGFTRAGRTHVHARTGERGRVEAVEAPFIMVRWDRTGTACDVDPSEVVAAD